MRPRKSYFVLRKFRRAFRRATRTTVRVRWRAPDDLGIAIACYRRAITAHHRLARLAPDFFDSTVIERTRRQHEARRRWMDLWEPAFIKVYGSAPKPLPPTPELPPMPPPRTQAAVERALASWAFWFAAGRDALRHFQLRNPHAVISLSRIARLLEIGMDLARLATGLHSAHPAEPDHYAAALADLERIYGHQHDPEPPPSGPISEPPS
jgi:hypothetical protein